jgi:putative glycosyltransferase (TIGR04372 family)
MSLLPKFAIQEKLRDFLSKNPRIWIWLSSTRIVLRLRPAAARRALANAYCAMGHQQVKKHDRCAAVRFFRKALECDPDSDNREAFLALYEAVLVNPEGVIESRQYGGGELGKLKSAEATDWKTASYGYVSHLDILVRELNRVLKAEPENLGNFLLSWVFSGCGENQLMMDYLRRHREAQQALARTRGLETPGVRYLRHYWTSNIGHLGQLDWYIKAGLLGWRESQKTILLANPEQIANAAFLDYFRPFFHEVITDPQRIQELHAEAECNEDYYFGLAPLKGNLVYSAHAVHLVQQQWESERRAPLLALRAEHIERGQNCLRKLGVPQDAWFVGLQVRESGYHKNMQEANFRNAEIGTYDLAIRTITDRGGWVIRMGNPGMSKLKPMPQVVDYAHSDLRSDWMDIFLCGAARFCIGTQTGLSHVPMCFGVPSVVTNWPTVGTPPWFGQDLFLPKLLWSKQDQRHLSLREVLATGLGFIYRDFPFTMQQVSLVNNTPDEINDAVVEMLERLSGRRNAHGSELNRQVKSTIEAFGGLCLSQIGTAFLQNHPDYLAG